MGRRSIRIALALAALAAWPAGGAWAAPASGPHGTIDNQLTTTAPNSPTGWHFTGSYHAAGDPSGDPPYMRQMTFYPPPGMRYDTSVPERCTASDAELQARGAAACPAGSRIASGTARGKAMGQVSELRIEVFNNTGEMVMVVGTPVLATISRGKFGPDGSITYRSPTCFPAVDPCPGDNALQLGSDVAAEPYTRTIDGVVRSYLTTPPKCPKSRRWRQPVRFWWADGSEETIVTEAPCVRPRAAKKPKKRRPR